MKIVVIDSQGGGVGKAIIEKLIKLEKDLEIVAIGTNALATSAMLKAGAKKAATGENAIVVNSRDADIIIGPIGIAIADSMLGEISSISANGVASSKAKKILIPFDSCGNTIVGLKDLKLNDLIDLSIKEVEKML